jgi:hypothetical protein
MNFVDFIKEATSTASQQAARLGLQGNGHGDWYDNNGKLVAKTVKGSLKFFGKKKGAGEDEPSTPNKDSVVGQKIPHDQQQAPEEPAEDQPTKGALTIGFGRFNPPTVGHEALLKTIKKTAADGEYKVYPSHSQDSKKNPLDSETKIGFMKAMFPDHANNIIHDTKMRTIFDVLKSAYADGHSEVNIVVGADRRGEFESLANKYNGQLYNFENINIVSAGERDPDAEGVEGMSASKLRKAAGDGDFDTFVNGIPKSLDKKKTKELYNAVRRNMGIEESSLWQIAPKLDFFNLRENFVSGNVFGVGDLIENLNHGLIGRIIRQGTNYVIALTKEGMMFKSWIKDIIEVHEVGTDSYRSHVQRMTPFEKVKSFTKINKNKKK